MSSTSLRSSGRKWWMSSRIRSLSRRRVTSSTSIRWSTCFRTTRSSSWCVPAAWRCCAARRYRTRMKHRRKRSTIAPREYTHGRAKFGRGDPAWSPSASRSRTTRLPTLGPHPFPLMVRHSVPWAEPIHHKIGEPAMAKIFYETDANLDLIKDKTIGIIGFGSQGHAHALNLRDSGCNVMVGLYPGSKSWQQAQMAGLRVGTVEEVAREADIIMILAPDQVQRQVYYDSIGPGLKAGKMLMFAHGFNIHFNQILPPADVDVTMIAPKAPGHKVRETFVQGQGTPGIVAVHQNATENAQQLALPLRQGDRLPQ